MNQKLSALLKKQKPSDNSPEDISSSSSSSKTRSSWSRGVGRHMEKIIPIGLLVGFLSLIIFLFGDRLLPAQKVETISVLVKETALSPEMGNEPDNNPGTEFEANALFQASGWVEADPYPYRASTLVGGFVEEVLVLDGEAVKKGQIIARLVQDDVALDLQTAEQELKQSQARYEAYLQEIEISKAELNTLNAQINTAEARLAELDDIAERMRTLSNGAVPEQDVAQALLKQKTQQMLVSESKTKRAQIHARLNQQKSELIAREAALEIARVELARKQLALDRTEIISPIDGYIQSLHAAPGQKKMVASDNPESTTIAIVYDPMSLQARIDVPLEEAGKLYIGQPAIVKTSFLPEATFRGRVVRIVGESDIQRNTLQAKIEILEPNPALKPEMLCRAEFLGANDGSFSGRDTPTGHLGFFAPKSAIVTYNQKQGSVFRLNPDRTRIEKVEVEIQATETDSYLRVIKGLRAGDQLVNNPKPGLKHHQRINLIKK